MRQMQDEVGSWSVENFGSDQPAEYPMIGAGEEIGELTTSVLKRAQGIGDSDKYDDRVGDEAERDAIGDIVIYLMDTLHRAEDDVYVSDGIARVEDGGHIVGDFDDPIRATRMLYSEYGRFTTKRTYLLSEDEMADSDTYDWATGGADSLDILERNAAEICMILKKICNIRGFDFEDCVVEAWEEVSGRKWDADLEN